MASDALRSALGMTNVRIGGRYVLPAELTVFGLPVREVLLDDGLDSGVARYGVELPGQDVVALVRAASLHRQNGGWQHKRPLVGCRQKNWQPGFGWNAGRFPAHPNREGGRDALQDSH